MSTNSETINKLWHIYTRGYYIAVKVKKKTTTNKATDNMDESHKRKDA